MHRVKINVRLKNDSGMIISNKLCEHLQSTVSLTSFNSKDYLFVVKIVVRVRT